MVRGLSAENGTRGSAKAEDGAYNGARAEMVLQSMVQRVVRGLCEGRDGAAENGASEDGAAEGGTREDGAMMMRSGMAQQRIAR